MLCLSAILPARSHSQTSREFPGGEAWTYRKQVDYLCATSKLLLQEDGRFWLESMLSASAYFHDMYWGKYEYDAPTGALTLHYEGHVGRGNSQSDPQARGKTLRISVAAVTDSTVVLNASGHLWSHGEAEFRRERIGGQDLALQGCGIIRNVDRIQVAGEAGLSLVDVTDKDRDAIIAILNSAEYLDPLEVLPESGVPVDVEVYVKSSGFPHALMTIRISESHPDRIRVGGSLGWHSLESEAFERLLQAAKGYLPPSRPE